MDDKGWVYPSSPDPLLWACNRRYFYNGQLVMEVKGGNIFDTPTIQIVPGFENLTLIPANMEYLRKRNEDSLFLIEHEAMDFINETFRRYKGLADVTKKESGHRLSGVGRQDGKEDEGRTRRCQRILRQLRRNASFRS